MGPCRCATSLLPIAILLCSGCCSVQPSQQQVEAWVHEEMPVGSGEDAVKKFCTAHHFAYEGGSSEGAAQAWRPLNGCDWQKPIVQVEISYDAGGRVTQTSVNEFAKPVF